jgi:hypothetical protein
MERRVLAFLMDRSEGNARPCQSKSLDAEASFVPFLACSARFPQCIANRSRSAQAVESLVSCAIETHSSAANRKVSAESRGAWD